MSENIVEGKSRKVYFHDDAVIKTPINNCYELKYSITLGLDGEFENLKEIYLWNIIEKYTDFRKVFANIFSFSLDEIIISAEKLDPITTEIFDKFYRKYNVLNTYSQINVGDSILDNHTLENYENFGLDKKGNLKILDYAIISDFILKAYNLDYEDLNNESFESLKSEMIKDIESNSMKSTNEICSNILSLYLALRFYDNNLKFFYISYKYNILDLKSIFKIFKEKLL